MPIFERSLYLKTQNPIDRDDMWQADAQLKRLAELAGKTIKMTISVETPDVESDEGGFFRVDLVTTKHATYGRSMYLYDAIYMAYARLWDAENAVVVAVGVPSDIPKSNIDIANLEI